jgi:hypothetical protein
MFTLNKVVTEALLQGNADKWVRKGMDGSTYLRFDSIRITADHFELLLGAEPVAWLRIPRTPEGGSLVVTGMTEASLRLTLE